MGQSAATCSLSSSFASCCPTADPTAQPGQAMPGQQSPQDETTLHIDLLPPAPAPAETETDPKRTMEALEAVLEDVAIQQALDGPSREIPQMSYAAATPGEVQPPQDDRQGSATPNEYPDGATTPEPVSTQGSRRPSLTNVDDCGRKIPPPQQGKPFAKRPMMSRLSQEVWNKAEAVFTKMDVDQSNAVTKEEATEFFKGTFGKLSVDAMFNEIDVDKSGAITSEEFMAFWAQVKSAGYKDAEMVDVMDELLDGGTWVDWNDGRNTIGGKQGPSQFPRRPWLCRLSQQTWTKCQELFEAIDADGELILTPEKAEVHFKGSFKKLSTAAMFKEVDTNHHDTISAKDWMAFWVQVKASGYKQSHIEEELANLLEGGSWVDWNDGRKT